MTITLHAERVTKRFDGLLALDGVRLELSQHDILGLIGPNGSGKSTLVNVLSGMLAPDSGRVLLGVTDITGWPAHRIAGLGIGRTFQTARLFASMTVTENVRIGVLGARGRGVDRQAAAILERLELGEWASTPASELPYGVQRRVEIARALATGPRLLLLDEPAAGLNEAESEQLLAVIRGLRDDRETGCGVLIIDHDLRLIMRLCERVHVLAEGRTIAQGSPEEVRADPAVVEAYLGRRQRGTSLET